MSYTTTRAIRNWKANGHTGYLMTWNGKRRITHKKAKPRKARYDWTLEEELATLEEREIPPYITLVDFLGEAYEMETETEEEDTDCGLDDEYLAEKIYEIDRYDFPDAEKTWFLGSTRDHVYTMTYSKELYAIYLFDRRINGTFIKVLQSGRSEDGYAESLWCGNWTCI